MRIGTLLLDTFRKTSTALILMLGATGVIFVALRAAPGTAVDRYTSLDTPIEQLALIRQELGFTKFVPLKLVSGEGASDGWRLDGSYTGNNSISVEVNVLSNVDKSGILKWRWRRKGDKDWHAVTSDANERVELLDGFGIAWIRSSEVSQGDLLEFSATNLDGRPISAYGEWLRKVARGDFGSSQTVSSGTPVMAIAGPAFLKTLLLAFSALILCMVTGIISIILNPYRSNENILGRVLRALSSAPSFVIGIFVMLVVNQFVYIYWNPEIYIPPEWYPIPKVSEGGFMLAPFVFAGLCIVFGDGLFTDFFNHFKAEYLAVKSAPFIAAIQAKGAPVGRHLFRNLIVPAVDSFAARLPLVLGAVIIVENMFGLTGGGWYLLEAAKLRDVPLVVGLSVLFTGTGIAIDLIAEIVKSFIDPREAEHGL